MLVVLGIAGGGYYLGKQQKALAPSATATLTGSPSASPTPSSAPQTSTNVVIKDKIIAAVNSKAYADLKPLMFPQVVVVLQATECCGSMPAQKAIEQLSYIKDATAPWNFDDTNATIVAIKKANPENYGNSVLGISANNYVVSFQTNFEGQISKISMSVDYKLLVP